jgi:hypothetical protein
MQFVPGRTARARVPAASCRRRGTRCDPGHQFHDSVKELERLPRCRRSRARGLGARRSPRQRPRAVGQPPCSPHIRNALAVEDPSTNLNSAEFCGRSVAKLFLAAVAQLRAFRDPGRGRRITPARALEGTSSCIHLEGRQSVIAQRRVKGWRSMRVRAGGHRHLARRRSAPSSMRPWFTSHRHRVTGQHSSMTKVSAAPQISDAARTAFLAQALRRARRQVVVGRGQRQVVGAPT